MFIFNNNTKNSCPICNTKDAQPAILIPNPSTELKNKNVCQATQVHLNCIIPLLKIDSTGHIYT